MPVRFLTQREQDFMASFGTPEEPMSIADFLKMWESLSETERRDLWIARLDG